MVLCNCNPVVELLRLTRENTPLLCRRSALLPFQDDRG